MKPLTKNTALLLAMSMGAVACGGGSNPGGPVDTDYSDLRLAPSSEGGLQYASSAEYVLGPLRNGLRMSLAGAPEIATVGGPVELASGGDGYSRTTIQVDGVDEADLVKYDGEFIYAMIPSVAHNVLKIARTDPATAQMQLASEFVLGGEQTGVPLLYEVQSPAGDTEYLAALSQYYHGWSFPQPLVTSLVLHPDRTVVQLVDVRDPFNVSRAWKIEFDGWLRGSRKIGDTLYLVSSYRPRLPGLVLPAETEQTKQANERRILDATAAEILPGYRIDEGAKQQLVAPTGCVLPANLSPRDAYFDLLVIIAIDLGQRRVTDANCVSTNVNGVYASTESLYVGGEGISADGTPITALHKFALNDGDITYRASGSVAGRIGWSNASYFMDEHEGDLRIVTSSADVHRLSILRETTDSKLSVLATLPNAQRPAAIGKPGEQVHAVRFLGRRAYVVTARVIDPLYAIDLTDPADPFIAGELEMPGVSTYLQPVGPEGSGVLLAVGREIDANGVRTGVKVELFDVSDSSRPRSLAVQVFGQVGSWSEATDDPHALTLLPLEDANSYRLALPITVSDMQWLYSGVHLLQIEGLGGGTPQLSVAGVIKTAEPSSTQPYPPYRVPNRTVLHHDSVFVVSGDTLIGSLWNQLPPF